MALVSQTGGDPTEAASALLKGIEVLERRGGCSRELAEAFVFLGAAHSRLPVELKASGLSEDQGRRLQLTFLRGEFEHALRLDPVAARKAMNRLAGKDGAPGVVAPGVEAEFDTAEAAALRTRKVPWLTLAAGGFYGQPTEAGHRGFTVGPYFYAGARLGGSRFGVGVAQGVTTKGGVALAAGIGIHVEVAARLAVFGGYGLRFAASDSMTARRGWVVGLDWVLR
jgi:hypothetical protein